MLFCKVDINKPVSCITFPELIQSAEYDARAFPLEEAIEAPINIGKGLYEKPIAGKCHILGENDGIDFSAAEWCDYVTMTALSSCAPVIVYDTDKNSETGGNVWAFHARGGDIPDGSMLFTLKDRREKLLIYTVREYGRDYNTHIEKILSFGYLSSNICIVTGYPNNIFVDKNGGVAFS